MVFCHSNIRKVAKTDDSVIKELAVLQLEVGTVDASALTCTYPTQIYIIAKRDDVFL